MEIASATAFRVRQILAAMTAPEKMHLKSLVLKGVAMPTEVTTQPYPAAVLACFPKEQSYSCLGLVAEELLRLSAAGISSAALEAAVLRWNPMCPPATLEKLRTSVTVPPFLEALRATRGALEEQLGADNVGKLRFDQELRAGQILGHPDMCTDHQMIEVKLTGLLQKNWIDFVFQLFAYGALCAEAKELLLVLPLQRTVLKWNIRLWPRRAAYVEALAKVVTRLLARDPMVQVMAALLREAHLIGHHAPKLKSLVDTVRALPDPAKPYQIFLGNPQSTKFTISDKELAAAAGVVADLGVRVYIHAPYVLNLATRTEEDWAVGCVRRLLRAAAAMGARGVVVHVGKSLKGGAAEAVATMRESLVRAAAAATAECPLLLETPAGQGTELLTGEDEFIDFVAGVGDERLRCCLDTCHVFACGHTPLKYLEKLAARPGLLKLVHYNDSAVPCGACVDRHAAVGDGHIGFEGMRAIAEFCSARELPMVIE